MAEAKIGDICYGTGGAIVYSKKSDSDADSVVYYTGKFGYLMTWWDFSETSGQVDAYINGICVCVGHDTSHIIDYDVIHNSREIKYGDGSVGYVFTMSITGVVGNCNFRCWKVGTDYDHASIRAQVRGSGETIATFELRRYADESWNLHAI